LGTEPNAIAQKKRKAKKPSPGQTSLLFAVGSAGNDEPGVGGGEVYFGELL
jgi:hypothetical protein